MHEEIVARGDLPVLHEGHPVRFLDVATARAVARAPFLVRGQREPSDTVSAAADRQIDVRAATADKADQRGRVHRPRLGAARHPTPARAEARPAAIVGGRKAPGRCIDPGPAPGRDVDPLAVAVGRPVGADRARVPDGAVLGLVAPIAVLVELLVTDHAARDVARRDRLVFLAVALGHPAVEGVGGLNRRHGGGLQVAARHRQLLAGTERQRFAVLAVGRAAAAQHRHAGGAGLLVGIETVFARAVDHEREVAGVDLQPLPGQRVAHPHLQVALQYREAHGLVADLGEVEAGLIVQPQRGRADVQLGARVAVGPEPVAGGDRTVRRGVVPAVVAGRRKAHAALVVTEAGDDARRVLLRQRQRAGREQCQADQPAQHRGQ